MAARLTGPVTGKLAAAIAAADAKAEPRPKVAGDALDREAWRDQVRGAPPGKLVCQFEMFGDPVAWARPGRNRAQGKTFTRKRQRGHMNAVATQAALAMRGRPPLIPGISVAVTIMVWMKIPASWPAWKKGDATQGTVRPTCKPDADNFAKLVKDALGPPKVRNKAMGPGVVWNDDAQVVDLFVRKFYTAGEPCTQVQVRLA